MGLLAEMFTWWNGQTIATRLFTSRNGKRVGEDAQGNVYYQTADGARRWVVYNGDIEASRVGPEWHGWLHHTFKEPPTREPLTHKAWEKPHEANPTGTSAAYHPPGSLYRADPAKRRDYDAWQPE